MVNCNNDDPSFAEGEFEDVVPDPLDPMWKSKQTGGKMINLSALEPGFKENKKPSSSGGGGGGGGGGGSGGGRGGNGGGDKSDKKKHDRDGKGKGKGGGSGGGSGGGGGNGRGGNGDFKGKGRHDNRTGRRPGNVQDAPVGKLI